MNIAVTGAGLAELTCAWLLARRGGRVHIDAGADTRGPRPLILHEHTLDLLRSLWLTHDGLFDDAHRLTHRRVRWGVGAVSLEIPQPAVVIDGAELANRLRSRLLEHHPALADPVTDPDWIITATADPRRSVTVGRRHLLAAVLPWDSDEDTIAIMTCTELAWIHLTPLGSGTALVQAVVPGPVDSPSDALTRQLAACPDLARRLGEVPPDVVTLPVSPRLHTEPALRRTDGNPAHLVVGAGALRYDPLSGTGTAQALRTAILATAVIHNGSDTALTHYATRLRQAFHDHLVTCADLYRQAFPGRAWHHEHDLTLHHTRHGARAVRHSAPATPRRSS